MNELERAAQHLAANPSTDPTPVADLQRAADAMHRRRRWRRLAVAAPIAIVVLVLAGFVVTRPTTDGSSEAFLDTSGGSMPDTTATTGPSTTPPPGSVPDDEGATVTVLAASGPIAMGMSGDAVVSLGLVAPKAIPSQYVPATAVRTTDALLGTSSVFAIAPDTIIVEGMFVGPTVTPPPSLPAPVETPEGDERLAWTLGPNQSLPLATATTLELSVAYVSCDVEFDLADTVVHFDADAIVVTVFGRPPLASKTCARPETSILTVELDEQVGDRRLFDGSPPIPVEVTAP